LVFGDGRRRDLLDDAFGLFGCLYAVLESFVVNFLVVGTVLIVFVGNVVLLNKVEGLIVGHVGLGQILLILQPVLNILMRVVVVFVGVVLLDFTLKILIRLFAGDKPDGDEDVNHNDDQEVDGKHE